MNPEDFVSSLHAEEVPMMALHTEAQENFLVGVHTAVAGGVPSGSMRQGQRSWVPSLSPSCVLASFGWPSRFLSFTTKLEAPVVLSGSTVANY